MANKYQVWTCKIFVPIDSELPRGFDWPPRKAATDAIAGAGLEIAGCASGWGGVSTTRDEELIDDTVNDVYIAGFIDMEPEGTA